MTLLEMKKKVLSLIEELNPASQYLTDDDDIANKLNHVINQVQNELARIKKITAYTSFDVYDGEIYYLTEIDANMYQLDVIKGVDYEIVGSRVKFLSNGIAEIYYFSYPTTITDTTEDTYVMELDPDVLEVMPYGVAADLLKSDVSAEYGAVYSTRYETMLRRIDPRKHTGNISIEGGLAGWL